MRGVEAVGFTSNEVMDSSLQLFIGKAAAILIRVRTTLRTHPSSFEKRLQEVMEVAINISRTLFCFMMRGGRGRQIWAALPIAWGISSRRQIYSETDDRVGQYSSYIM